MYRFLFLICAIVIFFSCFCISSYAINESLVPESYFRDKDPKSEIEVFFGIVSHEQSFSYDLPICPDGHVCSDLDEWHVYNAQGYIFPDREGAVRIAIAHRASHLLITRTPWLAKLQRITDIALSEAIGAEYLLVGLEYGAGLICPSDENQEYFSNWEPDLKDLHSSELCYFF